jgi:hypothetical protein
MMGLRQSLDAACSQFRQLSMQIFKARGIENFSREIFVNDVTVPGRREMNLEGRKDHETAFFVLSLQGLHHLRPNVFQTIETVQMIVDRDLT